MYPKSIYFGLKASQPCIGTVKWPKYIINKARVCLKKAKIYYTGYMDPSGLEETWVRQARGCFGKTALGCRVSELQGLGREL